MKIPRMFFEVTAACQNDCDQCQHGAMRRAFKGYDLSLEELRIFLDKTRCSEYQIEALIIHGIGEPLLWGNLNQGLQMIRNSGCVNRIILYTNGQAIDNLSAEAWRCVDMMHVNLYTSVATAETTDRMLRRLSPYRDRVRVYSVGGFRKNVTERHTGTIPCECQCAGPMYCAGRIWFTCGPVVFDACEIIRTDPFDLSLPVMQSYMDAPLGMLTGRLTECECCNANHALLAAAEGVEHKQKKGESNA